MTKESTQATPPTPEETPVIKEQKTSKWWWDPPKLIPILISSVALIVSGLSWWESHRVRLINEEVNRPILSLSILEKEASPPSEIRSSMSFFNETAVVAFNIKLINIGKTTAYIRNTQVEKRLPLFDLQSCKKSINTDSQIWEFAMYPTEVLPGEEKTFWTRAKVSSDCKEITVEILVDITYFDTGSGREYNQYFREYVNVSLAELEVKK